VNNRPPFLEGIKIYLPKDVEFIGLLFTILERLGIDRNECFEFTSSSPDYFPRLYFETNANISNVKVDFLSSDGEVFSEKVVNETGVEKLSPHSYQLINIEDAAMRLASASLAFVGLDHLGFNLPWFRSALHPRIANLRSILSSICLYHRFPTGEAWDFILPGDHDEISGRKEIDYSLIRKPKFEMVSFEKASTPLVQIDVSVQASYNELSRLFPESLKDPELGNIWVYLQNRFEVDVCLVINPISTGDWSLFFRGTRL
jgi:hypothetical protein